MSLFTQGLNLEIILCWEKRPCLSSFSTCKNIFRFYEIQYYVFSSRLQEYFTIFVALAPAAFIKLILVEWWKNSTNRLIKALSILLYL